MAEENMVITIGRQYGSGGAEVGRKLGKRLGLNVYDKEILKMTSDPLFTIIVPYPRFLR